MLVVQIRIGRIGVSDVLLDGEFRVNIIFERLWKKLGLKGP
jgi:hypothetical protein